jgi:2'-5' RNA ligase
MRHIVAHLIRGEAEKYHQNLTKDLTEKFDTFPIHDRIQPHLTLKRWFEIDDVGMDAVYKTIDNFVNSHNQCDYELKSFGHFGEEVVYLDVTPSKEMLVLVKDLKNELHRIEKLTFDEFDDLENDFHATLVFGALKSFNYRQVWDYLGKLSQPNFEMKFNNIAVLKKPVDKWIIDKVWEINP